MLRVRSFASVVRPTSLVVSRMASSAEPAAKKPRQDEQLEIATHITFINKLDGYESQLQGELINNKVLDLQHTLVPTALRGRGVAGKLVKQAFDLARERGFDIKPTCSYVSDTFIPRSPEDVKGVNIVKN